VELINKNLNRKKMKPIHIILGLLALGGAVYFMTNKNRPPADTDIEYPAGLNFNQWSDFVRQNLGIDATVANYNRYQLFSRGINTQNMTNEQVTSKLRELKLL